MANAAWRNLAYIPFECTLRVQLIHSFILLASSLVHPQPFFSEFQGFGEGDMGITTGLVAFVVGKEGDGTVNK
jgi:hypothetical protein